MFRFIIKMKYATLKVKEEQQDLIKRFCVFKRIKVQDFLEKMIKDNKELKQFQEELNRMKFS